MNNPEPKSQFASRTILGAVIVILSQVVRLFWPEVEIDVGATVDAVSSLLALFGAALAWYGRLKAERPIRWGRAPAPGAGLDPTGAERAAERLRDLPPDPDRQRPGPGGDGFWESRHDDAFFRD